jgi:hypothetical protein
MFSVVPGSHLRKINIVADACITRLIQQPNQCSAFMSARATPDQHDETDMGNSPRRLYEIISITGD